MIYLFRSLLTIFALSGFALNALTQLAGGAAAASTQTALVPEAQVLARSCETTLQSHGHDFAPEVDVAQGCACFARELTYTHQADLAAAEVLLVGVISSPPENATPDWNAIAAQAGIADADLGRLLQASHQAMGVCGQV